MKLTKLLIILTVFLLVGAGCASARQQKTATQNSLASTSSVAVIKNPNTEAKNPIYDFCEKNKNVIIIRFDQETQSSKAYCRFKDTTECSADEYFTGKCQEGQGNKIYQEKQTVTASEVCIQNYNPVCGQDNITYTNDCIARMQNIKISKTGVCSPPPATTPAVNPTLTADTKINTSERISPDSPPDWINIVKNFITANPPESPRTYISRCTYAGGTTYYQSGGCKTCYSTLYNNAGDIICYPDHDFSGSCSSFSPSSANCTRIWTDRR